MGLRRWVGRAIGLDVRRDFCVVAICEDGVVRSAGRVPSTPEGLRTLAESLLPTDRVALEVTGSCWEVARLLEPHVERVIVVSPDDTGITSARAKTDKLDTRATPVRWPACCGQASSRRCGCPTSAAGCCAAGSRAASSWCIPVRERRTRSMRCSSAGCRASRRALTCSELRAASGSRGWSWRPRSASRSTPACVTSSSWTGRSEVERLIAGQALSWPEVRRLMTVPGVNLIGAASFIAAVGDPNRFLTSRKLVAYLGLDSRVKQSGEAPTRSGRISKRGSASARWALVEAAWSAVLQPGPLHAFYERTRNRRGHGKAIVATARKLAVLFWCMLTRSQDYAHRQPSLTKKKLRRLEITAGAPKYAKTARGTWSTNVAMRQAERQLAEQAEASYKRMVKDWQAGAPARKVGASVTPRLWQFWSDTRVALARW
jgi:transposase